MIPLFEKLYKTFFSREDNPAKAIPYKVHPAPPYHPIYFAKPSETFAVGYSPAEFKELTGVTYLPHLQFDSLSSLRQVRRQCHYMIGDKTISPSVKWLGIFFAKELAQGFVNDVHIRWIDETIGYGVFASRRYNRGEYIGEYTGIVKKTGFFSENLNEFCFHYPTDNLFIHVHTIDPKYKGNEMRFMNHSNKPNCEAFVCYFDSLLHVCIRTIQTVEKGTELTFDYGKDWWGDRSVQTI